MATYTPNLNLKKPSTGEKYDMIADLNDAKDKIDIAVGDNTISVKKFGAKGDEVADDTIAIQSALDYAHTLGGARVYIPKGRYKITAQLKIYSNTTVTLNNSAVMVNYIATGSTSVFSNFHVTDDVFGYDGEHDITIKGGTILNIPNNTYPTIFETYQDWGNQGMTFAHGKNILIERITIKDTYRAHPIELTGCDGVEIKHCTFDGWLNNPLYDINPTREAAQIEEAGTGTSSAKILDGTQCQNIKIHNNKVAKINSTYLAQPCGFGSHSIADESRNIEIYDNDINGCSYAGISYGKFIGGKISNNVIKNCGSGLISKGARPLYDFVIEDNLIDGMALKGINLSPDCKNVTMRNNKIKNTLDVGFYIDQGSIGMKIYENYVLNGGNGIIDTSCAKIAGLKNSFVFNNIIDKDNDVNYAKGLRFIEGSFANVNTKQWNNQVLFECTQYDIDQNLNLLNLKEVINTANLPIFQASTVALKINPWKYRTIALTITFVDGVKTVYVPVTSILHEVTVTDIDTSGNILKILQFAIAFGQGTITISSPRLSVNNAGALTTTTPVVGDGYTISKIEGLY